MRRALAVLTLLSGCSATVGTPVAVAPAGPTTTNSSPSPPEGDTSSPYAGLFEPGARWEFPAQLQVGDERQDGTVVFQIAAVTTVGDTRTARMEAAGTGALERIMRNTTYGLLSNGEGYWVLGKVGPGHALSRMPTTPAEVAELTAKHPMRLASAPVGFHVTRSFAEVTGPREWSFDAFAYKESWCTRDSSKEAGMPFGDTMCLSRSHGITGGNSYEWKAKGLVAVTYGDSPPIDRPESP